LPKGIMGAFQIFAASTCVSPHPLKGSTVLKFDIPLQGIGAKSENLECTRNYLKMFFDKPKKLVFCS